MKKFIGSNALNELVTIVRHEIDNSALSHNHNSIYYTKNEIDAKLAVKSDTSHTHSAATQSANGFMSSNDKKKLDGIASGANAYTHPASSGNKHIPSGGSSGQILRWSSDGTAIWGNDNNTTYSNFVKSGSGAKAGLVPAPSTTAGTTKYLREDGTWTAPTAANIGAISTSKILTTKDQVNTNTDVSNVAGATAVKQMFTDLMNFKSYFSWNLINPLYGSTQEWHKMRIQKWGNICVIIGVLIVPAGVVAWKDYQIFTFPTGYVPDAEVDVMGITDHMKAYRFMTYDTNRAMIIFPESSDVPQEIWLNIPYVIYNG